MRILPTRKMRLDGQHIDPAIPVDVSPASAELAIRNRWATAMPESDTSSDPQPIKRKRKESDA